MDPVAPTTLTVNDRAVEVATSGSTPLLYALRNELGHKGVRAGCSVGECGACTVLVNGVSTRSCLTPVEAVAGAQVVTPEGLGTPDQPHGIQQAFLDEQAAQCGYCINGIVMSVAAVAAKPAADRASALDAALTEHLCRCGTHSRILAAARRALGVATAEQPSAQPSGSGACVAACARAPLPAVLSDFPDVADWLRLLPDGRVEVRTGKVELGQGIRTAMAQMVAAQLDILPADVLVRAAATSVSPDERYTAGSLSVEQGSMAVAAAAVALRRLLLQRAGRRLGVDPEVLGFQSGAITTTDGGRLPFVDLVGDGPLTGQILESDRPHWHGGAIGTSLPRQDLPSKVTGAPAYVHDMVLEGMLHARAVLPPSYGARLTAMDDAAAAGMPGVVSVVRDGSLVIVIAEREEQAVQAAQHLKQSARWSDPGLDIDRDIAGTLRNLPAQTEVARDDEVDDAFASATRRHAASYFRPYQAHGAMAPSCAVAVYPVADRLRVYSHTQGVYPLRRELATILDMAEEEILVQHADGPGCYGHNCADDAAALAALAAHAVQPSPVRLLMFSDDELAWDPFGSAMLGDLEAGLDAAGRIVAWRHRARTDVHTTRPTGSGDRLIPSWLRGAGRPRPQNRPHETGMRNSIPLYDIPAVAAATDFVAGPLRTSALRSLASHMNVFAIESFLDELAELANADPVAFRLDHLADERARAVLDAAAAAAGWQPHVGPSGRGQGVAVCRYKSTKAYAAAVVDATMDPQDGTITVSRVVLACDAGVVVNPDGLRNQLEGGVIQGLSRALVEEVRADRRGVHSRDWTTYPVLRFSQVPPVDVVLLDGGGAPPVGAGEAATPVVAPALANAIDDAIGIRLRSLPLTGEQAQRRLADMTAEEMARVRLA